MYKFKNQQKVMFAAAGFKGTGIVVGYNVTEQPVIGECDRTTSYWCVCDD